MKFSVLLPTRNRLDLLARAIETVRRQDFDDWEIIVSDNISEEDVAGYIASLADRRIHYFRTDRFLPVTDNWNNAIEKSSGDYVIMLGDDDGLMRGYFSNLAALIEKFDFPDFIYTNAFLYAYPGVMPGIPDGFLKSYGQRPIFHSREEPFWLDKRTALEFVGHSLNFKAAFDYNMQFSLVSRKLISRMKPYGSFYQSPYPDYYASNAMLLKAERVLIVPKPAVIIGISPKSFGYYYFNDAEENGNSFLNNLPDKSMVQRINQVILPGSAMNTSWLIAMETLFANFSREYEIKVNYARYRHVQIHDVYAGLIAGNENSKKIYREFKQKMLPEEWLRYGLLFSTLTKLSEVVPQRLRASLSFRVKQASQSHPKTFMPCMNGRYDTILDVFERVDPDAHIRPISQ